MAEIYGLSEKIDRIVEAAIAAYLKSWGFTGSAEEGFTGPAKGDPATQSHARVHVSYPDGTVTHDGGPTDAEPLVPVREVYGQWDRRIREAFRPYQDTPTPEDFQSDIDLLGRIVLGLRLDPDTQVRGASWAPQAANTDLDYVVDEIYQEMQPYADGGTTMDAVEGCLHDTGAVIQGHQTIATVLRVQLAGEQRIWKYLRDDVLQVADQVLQAFLAVARGQRTDPRVYLKLAKSLTEVLAAFIDHKAVTIPALVASVSNDWVPESAGVEPIPLQGSTANEVYEKLLDGLNSINHRVAWQEGELYEFGSTCIDHVNKNAPAYDLTRKSPEGFLSAQSQGEVFKRATRLDLRTTTLRSIAGKVQRVAATLGYIRSDLQMVLGKTAWERDRALGLGQWGHYPAFEELHGDLTSVMGRCVETLGSIAEQMVRVSYDFDRTEEQIEGELRRQMNLVHDNTPKDWVPYGYVSDNPG